MARTEKDEILRLKEVYKSFLQPSIFGGTLTKALNGVSFSVKKNEVFSLIGLNGSGKTTCIKTILGLTSADSGEVSLFNSDGSDPRLRSRLGYLPEIPYFKGDFTPLEMLSFWGRLSGLRGNYLRERIDTVLGYTSLTQHARKKLKGFSRGMLQRLGIAQTLLSDAEFLILDEPMGGLDPRGMADIRRFIQEIKEEGRTILFSSHIISEVEKLADRVAMIHQGRIIKITSPHENLEEDFLRRIEKAEKDLND